MATVLRERVDMPAAWTGSDIRDKDDWIYRLSETEIAELDAALQSVKEKGCELEKFGKKDFVLPTLGPAIGGWLGDLDKGRGFVLVKGFPAEKYSKADCALVYWGIGLYLGTAVPQNTMGDLLGHVRDTGEDPKDPNVRLYRTRAKQDFHTDGSDIVGLMCLRKSKSGGLSRIVSSVSIYNEILKRRPELIELMYEPMAWHAHGQRPDDEPPFYMIPICTNSDGRPHIRYAGWYIREAQDLDEAPRMSQDQYDLVDMIEEIGNDPRFYLDIDFEIGEIQFLKNAVILHQRTEYEDWDDPDKKRHLLRLWLAGHNMTGGELDRDGIKPKKRD